MEIFAIISGILNLVLTSGIIVTLATLRSVKAKAKEEAKGAALENIDAAVETWKKIVNSLQEQIDKLLAQRASDAVKIEGLSEEVKQQNQRIEHLQEQVASMDAKVKSVSRLEKTVARYEKLMDAAGIEY
jgi:peptidoglycan hydrolase CwlO-like protein